MKPINELQHKLQVYADLEEAREYYHIIKTKFADRKWILTENEDKVTPEAWQGFESIDRTIAPGGWGLQSHLETDDKCPPWIITTYQPMPNPDGDMIFGFARKLLDKIPMAKWLGISETPPGSGIVSHQDSHWHIHLPLYSPAESYLTWNDENGQAVSWQHFPADGAIHAWQTTELHSVVNNSNELRVHMFFKVEMEDLPELLKLTGKI